MILFVVNQIAGAEYILPLLKNWKDKDDYIVLAAEPSQNLLRKNEIDFVPFRADASAAEVGSLLSRLKVGKAVLSTSMTNSVELLFVEKLGSVPTIQFIDTWSNYLERFTKVENGVSRQVYPNFILTLNEASKKEMLEAGIDTEIRVIGQPHLEMTMANIFFGFGAEAPLLAGSQPISQFYSKSLGYDQFDFADGLAKLSQQICLLIHPSEDLQVYRSRYGERFVLSRLEDVKGQKFSGCIGMFSSVMVQAALAGIPTLSFQPQAKGPNKCGLSRLGFIPRVVESSRLSSEIAQLKLEGTVACQSIRSEIIGSLSRLENFLTSLEPQPQISQSHHTL